MTTALRATWRIVRPGGVVLAGLLILAAGGGAEQTRQVAPVAQSKPIAVKEGKVKDSDPLAEPLALAAQARKAYAKVRDYSCTLIKRERMDGTLTANHVIAFKMRTTPFSVSMRWVEPRELAGQEVCYVAGKNNGDMRVKPPGLLGAIGFLSLSPDDEHARKTSKHSITDAGIGWVIERCATGWEVERKLKRTKVSIGTFQYANRRCTRAELIHSDSAGGKLLYQRNVIYFDQQTHLPIRVENYDWPQKPGGPAEVAEVYSYVNLRLNVDLPDEVFEH
jgi:hypothetical protein